MPMKDYKPYKGQNGKEDFWERIYELPQVNIGNSKAGDPFDKNSSIDTKSRISRSPAVTVISKRVESPFPFEAETINKPCFLFTKS